jgi:GNAT superfamily N-acetyltransferase
MGEDSADTLVPPAMRSEQNPPSGLLVREARAGDNDALIDLELRSPLLVGESEEKYDRSPDFFACYRVQGEHRVILAEVDGRTVGVMAGVVQAPVIQGAARRLVYIQRARVLPEFQGQGVAWRLANDLFAWSSALGAEGPYYLIAPGNERSVAFGGRAGRRWPVDVRLLTFDVSDAGEDVPPSVAIAQLDEAAALINATQAWSAFFEPVTAESLMTRLSRDDQYRAQDLHGAFSGGRLVAVAGLWDKGANTEHIRTHPPTGMEVRSRTTAVIDWGCARGHKGDLSRLLAGLAAKSRMYGRQAMTICEPRPGMFADPGERREASLALYTPTIDPPKKDAVRGMFADLLII